MWPLSLQPYFAKAEALNMPQLIQTFTDIHFGIQNVYPQHPSLSSYLRPSLPLSQYVTDMI